MRRPDRRSLRRWLALAPAVGAFSFLLLLGATWRGIGDPIAARISLLVIGSAALIWRMRRRGDRGPHTAFDPILPLWIGALALSTAVNLDRAPLIFTGIWFASVYAIAWYALQDALASGLIVPDHLRVVLLTAGIPVLISAFADAFTPPAGRISGALENPNTLGGLLALLIPLIVERLLAVLGRARWLFAGYLVSAAFALLLTESRGAMLAVVTALLVIGLTRAPQISVRAALIALYVGLVIGLINVRGDSGRLPIYTDIAAAILERPLTGTGLFTFRLVGMEPIPASGVTPGGTNLYAHNLILHVAVELGLPGLIALALTGVIILRRWPDARDPLRLWAYAAIVGAGAHQMVDFPLMMPGLALAAIAVLGIALPPDAPARPPARAHSNLIAGLALAVWLIGMLLAPLRAV